MSIYGVWHKTHCYGSNRNALLRNSGIAKNEVQSQVNPNIAYIRCSEQNTHLRH